MNLKSLVNRDERLLAEQEKLNHLIKDLKLKRKNYPLFEKKQQTIRSRNYGTAGTITYGKSII